MKKGKLLIIEGGDGAGKATQTARLYERLQQEGHRVKMVSFPNYDSDASALVKMYLKGEFGTHPSDVNPYVASTFYAVDRFASWKKEWKELLEDGGIVLADRYTTSNMVHQMVKYEDPVERNRFLDWLWDFEFCKLGLPVPDQVLLLDVPLAISEQLMANRQGKTGGETGDIHEKDRAYLRRCHEAYDELVAKYGWTRIACTTGDTLRSISSIHEEMYRAILPHLA